MMETASSSSSSFDLLFNPFLFGNIARFLSWKDAVHAHLVCKFFHDHLYDYKCFSLPNDFQQGGYYDQPKIFYTFPTSPSRVKRIRLSVDWKDQGWGNRKSQFSLHLTRDGQTIAQTDLFGIAYHDPRHEKRLLENEDIVELSKRLDVYEVWRYIGCGGGHSLDSKNFNVVFELYK